MTRIKNTYLAALAVLLSPMAANADLITDRTTFEGTLGATVVDDYENASYLFNQSNSVMSAVLGETQYTSTRGEGEINIVFANASNHKYCGGCNGSFLLDFTSTSVGSAIGVFGVGFEYFNQLDLSYFAFITYGDGSTENVALASVQNNTDFLTTFFGVTSTSLISSIHLGLINGGATTGGSFGIDNLTIGSSSVAVPEPGTLALLGLGLAGIGFARRKKV